MILSQLDYSELGAWLPKFGTWEAGLAHKNGQDKMVIALTCRKLEFGANGTWIGRGSNARN